MALTDNSPRNSALVLHERSAFLGEVRRRTVLDLLTSPDLAWERSDRLGRTTSGTMWQLASAAMHARPEIVRLGQLMAASVYEEIREHVRELPEASGLVPQVFPVRMAGNTEDPPAQQPHRDGARGKHPVVTALFYAEVCGTAGGELLLHDDAGNVRAAIEPVADTLLVIRGEQTHSVAPLTAGARTTIVTNFYADEVAAPGHCPAG